MCHIWLHIYGGKKNKTTIKQYHPDCNKAIPVHIFKYRSPFWSYLFIPFGSIWVLFFHAFVCQFIVMNYHSFKEEAQHHL